MPYSVGKSDSCPTSKPHAVLRDDGSVAPGGCHPTRGEALQHQRALMVNVPDAKKKTSASTASLFERSVNDGAMEGMERTVAMAAADTVTCPYCGSQVPASSSQCPDCGAKMADIKEKLSSKALEEAFGKNYSQAQRAEMAKDGRALPDKSFPINDCGDVSDAVPLVGRYKGQYDAKAHVKKRAKALGCTNKLPADW